MNPSPAPVEWDRYGPFLTPGELQRLLRMKPRRFYIYQRDGQFDRFLMARPIGRMRYVKALVRRAATAGI